MSSFQYSSTWKLAYWLFQCCCIEYCRWKFETTKCNIDFFILLLLLQRNQILQWLVLWSRLLYKLKCPSNLSSRSSAFRWTHKQQLWLCPKFSLSNPHFRLLLSVYGPTELPEKLSYWKVQCALINVFLRNVDSLIFCIWKKLLSDGRYVIIYNGHGFK